MKKKMEKEKVKKKEKGAIKLRPPHVIG